MPRNNPAAKLRKGHIIKPAICNKLAAGLLLCNPKGTMSIIMWWF